MLSGTPIEDLFRGVLSRLLLEPLKKIGATPNHLTLAGAGLSILSALLIPFSPFLGGLLLVAASSLDSLDGTLARSNGQATSAGAFLDSVVDRFSEFFVLLGCWVRLVRMGMGGWAAFAVFWALQGSLMVSYSRARAEGLGFRLKGGFFERPERVLAVCAALLLTPWESSMSFEPGNLLFSCLALLALGSNLTAAWRIYKGWSELSRRRN